MRRHAVASSLCAMLLAGLLLGCAASRSGGHDFGTESEPFFTTNLDDDTRGAWRRHVWPSEDELAWEEIPWLPTFGEGVLAAHEAERPLLTWVMNGHPLGCT